MSNFLTVRSFGALDLDHAAIIASLPASLRLVEAEKADIAIATPDLTSIASALAAAPKALVVTRPALLDDATVDALGKATIPVFPALLLAPRLQLVDTGATVPAARLIRSRLAWHGTMYETLLEHLAGLNAALGPLQDVRLLAIEAGGHIGTALSNDGVTVSWSGQSGSAQAEYELDIVGVADRLEVLGDLDGSARPLLVRHGTASGLQQPHGQFETGLRLFWRAIIADVVEGKTAPRWPELAGLRILARNLAGKHAAHSTIGAAS